MFVGPVCYAESKDGIHWEKVNLGQLLFKGNRDNNAFDLGSALTAGALVIKDEEDPDPQRRYKMTFWVQHHPLANSSVATIQSATSPDGIKWKTAEKLPMPNTFREEGSFYKHNTASPVHTLRVTPCMSLERRKQPTGAAMY